MTQIDNSKVFLNGIYTDQTVTLDESQTLKAGTVLGRNSDGDLVAFSTDNNVEAGEDTEAFVTEQLYILAQDLVNTSTSSTKDVDLARVFECGEVDKAKLIFVKTADASDVDVLDALKKNGFKLETVQEMTEETPLRD